MVGQVLTRNRNITERLKNDYSLIGYESLSEEEVSKLIQYCESKIEVYIESRGGRIWAHRSKSAGYVSGSLRYNLLKHAKSRCELCSRTNQDQSTESSRLTWAQRLKRAFEFDVTICALCGATCES